MTSVVELFARGEGGFGRSLGWHAVAWLGFEAGVGSSCGCSLLLGWGARQQLNGGEPLDDAHGSAAERALGKRHGWLDFGVCRRRRGLIGLTAEQAEAERQQLRSLPVAEEAEVADANEAAWHEVQQEAAQEFVCRQAHDALPVAMLGVSPAEADLAVREGDQPAVRDTDAMGVSAEIAQRMLGSAEGPLGVNHPVVTEQDSEPGSEAAWFGKRCEVAVELELAFAERRLEAGEELAAEDTAEHLDRQEERTTRRYPAGMIRCEPAGGDHAVNMRMVLQALVPGVEHAEEADFRAQVSRIARDLEQRRGTGAEQQAVDHLLVPQRKWSQFTRHREDRMDVAGRQQLALALPEPADAGVALALRAVPVATRVVGDGRVSAAGALVAMAAESGRAATRDRSQHLLMLAVDPPAAAFDEALPGVANDVGQLHGGAAQALRKASPCDPSASASSGLEVALKCLLDRCR